MATQLQSRRGTTAQMNAFTGAEGEIAVNTSTDTLHVHDGSTAGGHALAKADGSNIATYAGSFTTISASGTITGNLTGNVTGNVTGDVTGDVTGNVTGNVTGDLTGSVITAAQTNITSVGTLSTLAVTGTVTADGLTIGTSGTNAEAYFNNGAKTYRLLNRASDNAFSIFDDSLSAFRLSVGTGGDISFYNSAGTSQSLFWDASAESLGIGTSSPTSRLHLDGAEDRTGGLTLSAGGQNHTYFLSSDFVNVHNIETSSGAAAHTWQTNGAERMRIAGASGNVGIGTTNALNKFVVAEGTNQHGLELIPGTTSYIQAYDRATSDYGDLRIDAQTIAFATDNGSEKMRIDSSGNVGIGTSSPVSFGANTKGLTLNGTASGQHITWQTGGSAKAFAYVIGDDFLIGSEQAGANTRFLAAGTEAFRITAARDMYFGQTSGSISNVGTILQANGRNFFMASTTSEADMHTYNNTSSSGAKYKISFKQNGTQVGVIEVGTSSTAYITSSDYRVKENVTAMSGATDRLKQLKPSRFNFIADADTTVDGFLAHEVSDVVPEAISGTKDAMMDEEYEVTPAVLDDDGNVTTEAVMGTRSVPNYQGIDQSKLVPLLVATIQELEARLTALENN